MGSKSKLYRDIFRNHKDFIWRRCVSRLMLIATFDHQICALAFRFLISLSPFPKPKAAYCEWRSATRMRVFVDSTSTIAPGDSIFTSNDALVPFGFSQPLASSLSATLTVSSLLLTDISVQLHLPSVLNLCSSTIAIALAQGYNDPRPLVYVWSALGASSDISTLGSKFAQVTGPIREHDRVSIFNPSLGSAVLLTKSDLLPGYSYEVAVEVRSNFGVLGSANATVERISRLTPTVTIDGPPVITPPLTEDLLLHGYVDSTTCTPLRSPTEYR